MEMEGRVEVIMLKEAIELEMLECSGKNPWVMKVEMEEVVDNIQLIPKIR